MNYFQYTEFFSILNTLWSQGGRILLYPPFLALISISISTINSTMSTHSSTTPTTSKTWLVVDNLPGTDHEVINLATPSS